MSSSPASASNRLETFVDGVFAIAITLLIIEIRVPAHQLTAEVGLWHALGEHWPSYLAYALSFVVIGIMWASHHNIFKYIRGVTHVFIMLNILLLLFTAFIPFTTAVLADYLLVPDARVAATAFYGAVFTCTAIAYNLLWRYAAHKRRLLKSDADDKLVRAITKEFSLGPVLYGAATALAFVNVWLSLSVHAFLALMYMVPKRFRV
jgi:uncharacterized membrane protein